VPRIYLYKLTSDDGGAPCVHDGLLTLAICKPMIRSAARIGDLIFGFAANRMYPSWRATDNHLIYVARVEERLAGQDYYGEPRFASRTDCVYELVEGVFAWREGATRHGPQDLVHDLGERPFYRRAVVLASRDYGYFGAAGTSAYKAQFPAVKDAVEGMGRGHRVHHHVALRGELLDLKDLLWRETTQGAVSLLDAQRGALAANRCCRRNVG